MALPIEAFDLHVCEDDPARSFYWFRCSTCGSKVVKPADDRVIQLLTSGGIRVLYWRTNVAEVAPPFTIDDLLDFHNLLADDELVGLEMAALRA